MCKRHETQHTKSFLLNGFKRIIYKKEVCRMRQLHQTDRGQPLAPAYLLCTLRDVKHLTSSTNSADNTHLGLNDSDKTKTRLKTSSSVLIPSRNVYRVTRGIINASSELEDYSGPILDLSQGGPRQHTLGPARKFNQRQSRRLFRAYYKVITHVQYFKHFY